MWRHIVVEGYCFADPKYPCGNSTVSPFCLLNKFCPHFGYADSNEREAACWVPLWLVALDRMKGLCQDVYCELRWHIWERWSFKKSDVLSQMQVAECPEWDNFLTKAEETFPSWLAEARKQKEKKGYEEINE